MHNNISKMADLKEKCKFYMSEKGLAFGGQIIADNQIHRYSADSQRNKLDEWYTAFEGITFHGNPFLICIFGSWSDGSKYEYRSYDKETKFNQDEKIELKKFIQINRAKAEEEIKASHESAAKEAKIIWNKCSDVPPMEEYSGYLKLKGIEAIGIRFGLNNQNYPSIIVPIKNTFDDLRSLQYISVDNMGKSYKSFLYKGEKRGNFHILGNISKSEEYIFITEGYATGVSVYKATNKPVVTAFDAGNIEKVLENIKSKFPHLIIIIAGDDDETGRKKATEAANRFGCEVVFPEFSEKNKNLTDFNDLFQVAGIEEARKQLLTHENNLRKLAENYITSKEEPCDKFKLSLLPQPLRDYVGAICKTTDAHPIIVVSSVLTTVSAFVGTKVYLPEGEYFQDLYPNIWTLCIARSGQFKTTALSKGAKIAIDKQTGIFKTIKLLQANNSFSGSNGEQILKKSLENVVLPTKLTAEAFLEYLSQGHQGAVYASEFGGWLQNLDKTHNNDFKAILTEFYDVPSYYRYKTKTQGDCIIETPYVSICGVSTMPWIQNNLKPSDVPSGFFARFLIFVPPYQNNIPSALPTPIPDHYFQEEERFKTHLNKSLNYIGDERKFYLSEDAKKTFDGFHKYIYSVPQLYSERAEEILQPYLKRWSPYLLKISILMQIFINPETDEIGNVAVMAAANLLIPAIKSTAMLFEGELGESAHQKKCRIIFEFICKRIKDSGGQPVKRKVIFSSKKLDGRGKEYDEVLQSLIDEGKIGYKEAKSKNESEYYLIEEADGN